MSDKVDYQKENEKLQTILAQLEAGDLDIDQAIKLYEEGQKIVTKLEAYLKTAENKITKLKTI